MSRALAVVQREQSMRMRPKMMMALVPIIGLLLISLVQLVLNNALAAGAHDLVDLKNEARELNTTVQIMSEEVDSLSSQQNLANSAKALGMVSNANPVFLKIQSDRVIGKPAPAVVGDRQQLSGNLVANESMFAISDISRLVLLDTEDPADGVARPSLTSSEVILTSGVIPASPTR